MVGKDLREIRCHSDIVAHDASLRTLAMGCPHLEVADFGSFPYNGADGYKCITKTGLRWLVEKCVHLTVLRAPYDSPFSPGMRLTHGLDGEAENILTARNRPGNEILQIATQN